MTMNRKLMLICMIAVLIGVFLSSPGFAGNGGNDRTSPAEFAAAFGDTIPCLIITGDWSIGSVFSSYADLKTKSGTPTKVVSRTSIDLTYSGTTPQERIRECIKDYYNNKNTKWVIWGGDTDIIPVNRTGAPPLGAC